MVGRHGVASLIRGVALGVMLSLASWVTYGQAPPDREPDVVLLRSGRRIDCVVVSISNEVLYYNLIGVEGLQQVKLHEVMTIALGAPKVDVLALAKQQAEAKRQAEAKAKQEAEAKQAAEEAAKQAEEAARRAEEARLAEEVRQAAARQAAEEAKKVEEAKKAEEARKAAEAEQRAKEEAEQKAKAEAEQKAQAETGKKGSGNAVVPTQVVASDAWKEVIVTKNEADVKGMMFVDKYDLTLTQSSNWSRAKSEEMEIGATVQLQKRAVQRRATHLLIREVEFKRTYGEPPAIRIVGEAYRKRS